MIALRYLLFRLHRYIPVLALLRYRRVFDTAFYLAALEELHPADFGQKYLVVFALMPCG